MSKSKDPRCLEGQKIWLLKLNELRMVWGRLWFYPL